MCEGLLYKFWRVLHGLQAHTGSISSTGFISYIVSTGSILKNISYFSASVLKKT